MFPIRPATPADAALIASHRRAMFEAMQSAGPEVLDEMTRSFEPWLLPRLVDGRYLGWIASDRDRHIASAGLFLLDWPPHPRHPANSQRGYILNVFVDPAYRRQGLARKLIEACLAEARNRKIELVTLHASEQGRPLYQQLGFTAANEMQLLMPQPGN